jgi:hypothetical protein
LTLRDAVADFVADPSVAVTVKLLLPFLALDVTVAVNVDVPVPLAIEVGLRFKETPVVAPPGVSVTVLL